MILRWINTPDDIFHYAEDYMRFYFLGMIPSMIYNMGSGIFRAVGDARRPLYSWPSAASSTSCWTCCW